MPTLEEEPEDVPSRRPTRRSLPKSPASAKGSPGTLSPRKGGSGKENALSGDPARAAGGGEGEAKSQTPRAASEAPDMPALRVRNRGTPINYSESSRTLTKRKDVGSEGSVPKKRRIDDGPKDGKGQETRSPSKAKGKEKDGEGAKEKEKDFSGVISETPLSRQKELAGGYIKAGLYSSASRVQTSGSPSGGKRKRDDWPFKLPLPIHWGEFLLSKERDFELPFDLVNLYETTGIAGDSALDEIRVSMNRKAPSKFEKIRRNIFVDRKPRSAEDWPSCMCVKPADGGPGCVDDECLNRATFIECNPKTCPCGDQCANQRFQKGERVQQLQLCQTLRRGHGLKTTVDIPSGTLIIEYRGEVMTEDSCLDRMAEDKNAVYFLNYDTGEVIDACRKGTEARFINHSCEPNCHIEKWRVNGEFCIGVVASGDIKAGTELTYDYKFESVSDDNMLQCHCGASKCRGLIGENGKVDGDRRRSKKSGSSSAATLSASSPPFKKRVDPERRFWLRKQKKDKLFYAIKEGNMNKARLMIAKLFLFRNLRSAEKALGDPSVEPKPVDPASVKRKPLDQVFGAPEPCPDMPPPEVLGSKPKKKSKPKRSLGKAGPSTPQGKADPKRKASASPTKGSKTPPKKETTKQSNRRK